MFWITDENDNNKGEFSLGGGDFEVIPKDTNCLAMISEAKWDDYAGEEYISLKWNILEPSQYKNRVIFHKLKVMQEDKNKAKKAQQMLLAINHNANGKVHELKAKPTNEDLQKNLNYKPMMINLQVWDLDGRKGNWISSVKPKGENVADKVIPVVVEKGAIPKKDAIEDELGF